MMGTKLRAVFLPLMAFLAVPGSVSCSDKEACKPYIAEVVAAAKRSPKESPRAYARRLELRVAAISTKYPKLQKQCRGTVSQALGDRLVASCVANKLMGRPPGCPAGWPKKRCCQLAALCTLRYSASADYCNWQSTVRPPPKLPRCTTCPNCVPEGTTPPPPQNINLWLGGNRETLAVVLDRPVNDSWLLPANKRPAHLEPMLYALWKQPGYLAPNVGIAPGETVPVDAWNTLEQAFHLGGWSNLGLNLVQWKGRFHCAPHPPANRNTFGQSGRSITIAITDGVVWVDGKQLLVLEKGRVSAEAKGHNPDGYVIAPLQKRLASIRRTGARVNVLRVTLRRGLTVPARLVAEIIYTSMQVLQGAHAQITCSDSGPVK